MFAMAFVPASVGASAWRATMRRFGVDTLSLAREIQGFILACRHPVVIEDGEVAFDLTASRYSVSGEHGKALLHFWSNERNVVRRVVECEHKRDGLILTVVRFGQSRPAQIHIHDAVGRRTPGAAGSARSAYQHLLRRVLERDFPGYTLERLTTAPDLERSFSPVYARGILRRGKSAIAVLGANAQEQQASVDAALTFGLLWLDHVRASSERCFIEGLTVISPAGRSAVLRARMAWLTRAAGKLNLFELDERALEMQEIDCSDGGNIQTRLVHCPDHASARERFAAAIATVQQFAPDTEVSIVSAAEVSFRIRGLEFARARTGISPGAFRPGIEIVFGVGAEETPLTPETEPWFAELADHLGACRQAASNLQDALRRAAPERWLESLVARDIGRLDPRLDPRYVYSQVPAFSASDRAMIDVLTATRDGRLAVLELKANEDINLPLQGLDYWARVRWHHERREFHRFGYFRNRELAADPPILMLVAPALHIHPATDTLLRYLSPKIEWELLALDEHWRETVRVVFRKRPSS